MPNADDVIHLGAAKSADPEVDPPIVWPAVITLKADNGKFWSLFTRDNDGINYCDPAKDPADEYCELEVVTFPGHLIALRSRSIKKYLSRINHGPADLMEFSKDPG
jgi:hypothetical protein